MRRAGKVDANHSEIVSALRQLGCSVQSLASVGGGCPDMVVGWRGRNILLEVKTETGRQIHAQAKWFAMWHGQVAIVQSAEDAISVVREQLAI